MSESAFIVRVPEAERLVGAFRERLDPVARLGVPAHVTVLFPFMPRERIDAAALERARAAMVGIGAFRFRLGAIRRFPGTLCLAPEPAAPFIALTEALARAFPDYPPYRGAFPTIVPHLTVAHGGDAELGEVEAELRRSLGSGGEVEAMCGEVALIENSTGRWNEMHTIPLLSH
jgi:hypothetical protein